MTTRRAALLLLLLLPLLLQGASLAHTHFGASAGLYNQEHDLTLLAAINGAAAPVAAAATIVVILVIAALGLRAPSCAALPVGTDADSRAPPLR